MANGIDDIDKKILRCLQEDATLSVAQIGEKVGLSSTPCWRRIQKLEQSGVIARRVVQLDPAKLNLKTTVFVRVRTNQHNADWLTRFKTAVDEIDEIVEFYRMSGDVDYLLKIIVPDIPSYDRVYQSLIERIDLSDVSSNFAMEVIKDSTVLPLDYLE